MKNIRAITLELSIAGQVTLTDLEQAVHAGYQSVLNLRSPSEEGFWQQEAIQAAGLGLHSVNAPVNLSKLTEELATHVLQCIDELPEPVLIHCGVATRAKAMVLMNLATRQELTTEQALKKVGKLD